MDRNVVMREMMRHNLVVSRRSKGLSGTAAGRLRLPRDTTGHKIVKKYAMRQIYHTPYAQPHNKKELSDVTTVTFSKTSKRMESRVGLILKRRVPKRTQRVDPIGRVLSLPYLKFSFGCFPFGMYIFSPEIGLFDCGVRLPNVSYFFPWKVSSDTHSLLLLNSVTFFRKYFLFSELDHSFWRTFFLFHNYFPSLIFFFLSYFHALQFVHINAVYGSYSSYFMHGLINEYEYGWP